ncbi:DeoR/GlpR family DNA-binding transcription regulator [Arthrobacter sp. HLT1-21]
MLAAERRDAIVSELVSKYSVRVSWLANLFGVSEMTIRRDIDALDAMGALIRVHGGATRSPASSALEPGFSANLDLHSAAKKLIARRASQLIRPGMTIALTGGTTVYQLAALLPERGPLTVLTNSLPVAELLHGLTVDAAPGRPSGITVLLTGGERSPSEALVGPLATATVRSLNVDICFMGVHGIHPDAGITTPNLAEADTNRAFAQHCARLVVLADATKVGVISLARIADLAELNCIVTDGSPAVHPTDDVDDMDDADAGDADLVDPLAELALHTTLITPDTAPAKETHP